MLSNVFDDTLLADIIEIVGTFTPTQTWFPTDIPELPIPPQGARREVLFLDNTDLKTRVFNSVGMGIPMSASIELWRDYPGYRNLAHLDCDIVHNIIIVYLDSYNQEDIMGTRYFENDVEYSVKYKKNDGIMLFNSDKILHGMVGEVTGVEYRQSLYITWKT